MEAKDLLGMKRKKYSLFKNKYVIPCPLKNMIGALYIVIIGYCKQFGSFCMPKGTPTFKEKKTHRETWNEFLRRVIRQIFGVE